MLDKSFVFESLKELKRRDPRLKRFGAEDHEYELNPPVSEHLVAEKERLYDFTFPEDYRHFMTQIGNGGAGPAYGVFRFWEQDDGFDFRPLDAGRLKGSPEGDLMGDPSKDFPCTEAWNLPQSFWDQEPDEDDFEDSGAFDDACEAWWKQLEIQYEAAGISNGAIPVVHFGCAYRAWLVVSGPERGHIWNDDSADQKGLYPVVFQGKRMTFSDWYRHWLEDALRATQK